MIGSSNPIRIGTPLLARIWIIVAFRTPIIEARVIRCGAVVWHNVSICATINVPANMHALCSYIDHRDHQGHEENCDVLFHRLGYCFVNTYSYTPASVPHSVGFNTLKNNTRRVCIAGAYLFGGSHSTLTPSSSNFLNSGSPVRTGRLRSIASAPAKQSAYEMPPLDLNRAA